MREFRSHGSVRGALSNGRPYREHQSLSAENAQPFRCRNQDRKCPGSKACPEVESTAPAIGGLCRIHTRREQEAEVGRHPVSTAGARSSQGRFTWGPRHQATFGRLCCV